VTKMTTLSRWLSTGDVSSFNPERARTIFTTIFIVLNFLIGLIGGRLIKRHNQRKLLKNEPVPVTQLVPWLSLGSTYSYVWSLRKIPGGIFGILMIISGAFGIINQYFVSNYILSERRSSTCNFTSGLVTTHSSLFLRVPSSEWPTAVLAFSAHGVATANNGEIGIWSKIDDDISNFCPTKDDILGRWVCTQAADSIIAPNDWTTTNTVIEWTNRQGFLYKNAEYNAGSVLSNGRWTNLMAWSADVPTNSTTRWNVRATIATPNDTYVNSTASNFDCRLDIVVQTWKPASSDSQGTLTAWSQTMLGSVLEVPDSAYKGQLEKTLNTITMVAGSGNSHKWNKTTAVDTGAGASYGCVTQPTVIFNTVFATAFMLILLLILLCVVDLYDFVKNMLDKRHKVVDKMPFDMLDWHLGLVQKMVKNENLEMSKLRDYEFYWCESTGNFQCRIMANKVCFFKKDDVPC
jgi:hypothetical protein